MKLEYMIFSTFQKELRPTKGTKMVQIIKMSFICSRDLYHALSKAKLKHSPELPPWLQYVPFAVAKHMLGFRI